LSRKTAVKIVAISEKHGMAERSRKERWQWLNPEYLFTDLTGLGYSHEYECSFYKKKRKKETKKLKSS